MNPPNHVRGLIAVALAAAMALSVASIVGSPVAGAQENGGNDARGYTPCELGQQEGELGQQDFDLLVMMDASGSLNKPRGKDPDGVLRSTALRDFRELLAGLLQRLPSPNAGSVRLALWRFDTEATSIVDFAPVSVSHPSEEQMRQSLGEPRAGGLEYSGRHTHYLEALRAAESAFQSSNRPDACRVLLFFTDGLHDPTGELTGGQTDVGIILQQADDLRREVCRDLKQSYERERINTYPILIGQDFGVGAGVAGSGSDDGVDAVAEMAEASMQALRALTGDANSPLVRGLPYSQGFDCKRWSDEQPGDRDGSIIAGDDDDLDVLAFLLLEIAETVARGLVEWNDCGLESGSGRRSGRLPAGRYIETIVAYPRGSLIEGYEISHADGPVIRPLGDWTRPLYLESADLNGLPEGWKLRILTDGGANGVEVACYHKKEDAQPPAVVVEGMVVDSEGQPVPDVVRSPDGPDSPPLDGIRIVAEAPPGLCESESGSALVVEPDGRVRDWYCRSDGVAVFELHPLECGGSYEFGAPLVYQYEPGYAADMFGTGAVSQEVRIRIAHNGVLYDCLGAPLLQCDDAEPSLTIGPDSFELPRTRLSGTVDCRLKPPPDDGVAELRATWQPDDPGALPGELDWRFDSEEYGGELKGELDDSGRVLRLGSGGDPDGVPLRFVTTGELENADWRIVGELELELDWQTDIDDPEFIARASEQMAEQRRTASADTSYAGRSDPGFARWLTLLVLLASLLLSYLLFCLALMSTFSLPDPRRYWWRHEVLGVRQEGSRWSFASGVAAALATAPAEAVRGTAIGRRRASRYKRWEGPQSKPGSDRISVSLRRSPRLWLPGLLRGAWSEVQPGGGSALSARPKGRKRSSAPHAAYASATFDQLIVVGGPRPTSDGGLVAPVWVALPKNGPSASPDRLDERELTDLLNEAAEKNDSDPGRGTAPVEASGGTIAGPASGGLGADDPSDDEPRSADPPSRPPPRRRPAE